MNFANLMEVIPSRELNHLYIYIDIAFLLLFAFWLWTSGRKLTVLFGIAGGIIYFIVDYGIFHLLLGSREVTGANTFWFLLWLSMSYGFTNFVWIWLWLSKDKRLLEWSVLILAAWFVIPQIATNFGGWSGVINIYRTTNSYHGAMGLILFVGYAIVCVRNINEKDKEKRVNIWWLLGIGILVQFGWEFMLLINGVRSGTNWAMTIVVNSLLETNLGIPYIYYIQRFVKKRVNEDLSFVHEGGEPESVTA